MSINNFKFFFRLKLKRIVSRREWQFHRMQKGLVGLVENSGNSALVEIFGNQIQNGTGIAV